MCLTLLCMECHIPRSKGLSSGELCGCLKIGNVHACGDLLEFIMNGIRCSVVLVVISGRLKTVPQLERIPSLCVRVQSGQRRRSVSTESRLWQQLCAQDVASMALSRRMTTLCKSIGTEFELRGCSANHSIVIKISKDLATQFK